MSANKKEKKKLKITSKQKSLLVIIGAALLVIIVGVIIAISGNNEDKDKDKDNDKEKPIVSTKETVAEEYGFTEEDAINVIKGVFNSDTYEFKAEVREDNMYIVTVTNPDSESKYTYVVDPNDGTFQELIEE